MASSLTSFTGLARLASGSPAELRPLVAEAMGRGETVLVFDDETGRQVDLDFRTASPPVEERKAGRPKLGVVAREVTLLPRHWEWLAARPGGASVALRKLVEAARRDGQETDRVRQAQEAAYRFLTALAGDLPGYQEAIRALYARDRRRFEKEGREWPDEVRAYALRLAGDALP